MVDKIYVTQCQTPMALAVSQNENCLLVLEQISGICVYNIREGRLGVRHRFERVIFKNTTIYKMYMHTKSEFEEYLYIASSNYVEKYNFSMLLQNERNNDIPEPIWKFNSCAISTNFWDSYRDFDKLQPFKNMYGEELIICSKDYVLNSISGKIYRSSNISKIPQLSGASILAPSTRGQLACYTFHTKIITLYQETIDEGWIVSDVLGRGAGKPLHFSLPSAIVFDNAMNFIIICERILRKIMIVDVVTGKVFNQYKDSVKSNGTDTNIFLHMALDEKRGRLYVLDNCGHKIIVFD